MIRRFVPEKEMQEYVKVYRSITEDNYEKGIIDEEFYFIVMQEIDQQYFENRQALAIERLLAANFM